MAMEHKKLSEYALNPFVNYVTGAWPLYYIGGGHLYSSLYLQLHLLSYNGTRTNRQALQVPSQQTSQYLVCKQWNPSSHRIRYQGAKKRFNSGCCSRRFLLRHGNWHFQ